MTEETKEYYEAAETMNYVENIDDQVRIVRKMWSMCSSRREFRILKNAINALEDMLHPRLSEQYLVKIKKFKEKHGIKKRIFWRLKTRTLNTEIDKLGLGIGKVKRGKHIKS